MSQPPASVAAGGAHDGGARIRRAARADAAALAALAARTFDETFGASSSAEDLALHLAKSYGEARQLSEIEDPAWDSLLAEAGGTLAGFAQLRVGGTPDSVTQPHPVELYRFYVDRPWHGRGVAQVLMAAVVEAARDRHADAIWLSVWEHNPRAQAFYAKCGFAKAGEKDFVVGTDVQTDWVMVCPLASDR
ncbi:MAG: GNAT family N-acetyltransferase [Gemmatimonadaceae bacterium]|nr:GNAT family N-acetyltransferase [Gemmatimonadaceae bacterium]